MKQTDLYGGDVTLYFDESNHEYFALQNGEREKVPSPSSITDVLAKPGLIYWAVGETISFLETRLEPGTKYEEVEIQNILDEAKSARFKSRGEAATIGTVVHEWIEDYIKRHVDEGRIDPLAVNSSSALAKHEKLTPHNVDAARAVRSFLGWEDRRDVEWLKSELMVYNRSAEYAGTFDALARVDGDLTVIDFKTSKGLYDGHYLQISGYAMAYEQMTGDSVQALLLRIPKVEGETIETDVLKGERLRETADAFLAALDLHRWQQ